MQILSGIEHLPCRFRHHHDALAGINPAGEHQEEGAEGLEIDEGAVSRGVSAHLGVPARQPKPFLARLHATANVCPEDVDPRETLE